MTNTVLLNEKIRDSGLKLNFIADKLGIVWMTLRRKIDGENDFKQSEIAQLQDLLRLSDEDVRMIFFAQE